MLPVDLTACRFVVAFSRDGRGVPRARVVSVSGDDMQEDPKGPDELRRILADNGVGEDEVRALLGEDAPVLPRVRSERMREISRRVAGAVDRLLAAGAEPDEIALALDEASRRMATEKHAHRRPKA